jgi:hypothetical protein
MKSLKFILIFSITTISSILYSQVNLEQINASLGYTGNTAIVYFNTLSNFESSGESSNIKIFFRMPSAQTSSSTTVTINSAFPFLQTTNVVSGGVRYIFFTATFAGTFNLASWMANNTYEIGQFTFNNFTGPLNVEMYNANQTSSSWNGTSMTKIVPAANPNNLVSWPVSEFAPLPITIKSFSATKDGERSARLDWTSSSEINSDYIGIERSTDGENWTTVGQVKAAGNSNRDIDYIYYDRSLPMARSIDNIFYYRLRLTDLDGQYKYSETRGVNMGRLEGLVSIYPNPATDIINVDLTDMDLHEGIIHLSVYDNTGKAIISKEVNGAGIEPIQASNMAAGSYQVVVKQGDTTHRKQIIVVN